MNFIYYIISASTSLIGSRMQSIVISIYILKITGSGLQMSRAASIFTAISLLVTPISGIISDKFNKKTIMITSDFLSFLTVGIFLINNDYRINTIIIMQGILISISTIFSTALMSIFSELSFKQSVESCNNIYGGMLNFINLFTPIIGLSLYGITSLRIIFIINLITFFLSGILETLLVYTPKILPEINKIKGFKGLINSYIPVWKYLKKQDEILGISFFAVFLNFFFSSLLVVLFPFFLIKHLNLHNIYIGYLEMFWAGGLILGNIIFMKFFEKINFKKNIGIFLMFQMISFIIIALFETLFPLNFYLIISGILIMLTGVLNTLVNVPFFNYLHKEVKREFKGRYFSLLQGLLTGLTPLGLIFFGFLLDTDINIRFIIVVSSFAYIIIIYLYFYKTPIGIKYLKK